jgi:hypothetical protein
VALHRRVAAVVVDVASEAAGRRPENAFKEIVT